MDWWCSIQVVCSKTSWGSLICNILKWNDMIFDGTGHSSGSCNPCLGPKQLAPSHVAFIESPCMFTTCINTYDRSINVALNQHLEALTVIFGISAPRIWLPVSEEECVSAAFLSHTTMQCHPSTAWLCFHCKAGCHDKKGSRSGPIHQLMDAGEMGPPFALTSLQYHVQWVRITLPQGAKFSCRVLKFPFWIIPYLLSTRHSYQKEKQPCGP